ncbi:MAG: YggS family pyridoxal phosphate-dependent enzyme [Arenicellales bacterium]
MSAVKQLSDIQASIRADEAQYHRGSGSVALIAVSKTRSSDEVLALYQAGQTAFGENYLQEALEKIAALTSQNKAQNIEWHFIGAIQSKKAKQIAENFQWVHSLDRLKVAERLNQFSENQPLNILIQMNLEDEASKGGVAPSQLPALAKAVDELEHLRFRGLMFMPKVHHSFEAQQAVFQQAKQIFDALKVSFPEIDQLSMGMSADKSAAISKGATMVRIGTALFGARPTK